MPTLKFIGAGVLWIVGSDLALFLGQNASVDHFPIFHIEVFKGIFFVIAMGVFFYVMQRKNLTTHPEVFELDLFKKNPQPMFIYNLQTMEFLDVNESAIGIYGYSRSEFLCMKVCDIRPAEDMHSLVKAIEQLQHGYRFIGQSRHIHKNGTIIHTEISAFSIMYQKHHAGLIMANDISGQVKAEQALIEAAKMHDKQMNDRLYEVALFNKELQVRIREINANNDELIEVNKLLSNASRNAVSRYEGRIRRIQQFTSEWMENVSGVMWSIDLHDERGTTVSGGALSYFGCSKQAFLDNPNVWETFVLQEDKARIKNELLRLNEKDSLTIRYKHIDGKRAVEQVIQLLKDEDEKVERITNRITILLAH
ncbi:MAG TPA: PAS domain-containing protein [Chryseosolibacter sp.]